jgi:hypothetical protein
MKDLEEYVAALERRWQADYNADLKETLRVVLAEAEKSVGRALTDAERAKLEELARQWALQRAVKRGPRERRQPIPEAAELRRASALAAKPTASAEEAIRAPVASGPRSRERHDGRSRCSSRGGDSGSDAGDEPESHRPAPARLGLGA